jgi:hypothetical protein
MVHFPYFEVKQLSWVQAKKVRPYLVRMNFSESRFKQEIVVWQFSPLKPIIGDNQGDLRRKLLKSPS